MIGVLEEGIILTSPLSNGLFLVSVKKEASGV